MTAEAWGFMVAAVGVIGTIVVAHIQSGQSLGKKVDQNREATEAQTLRNAMIGKLRICDGRLRDQLNAAHQAFAVFHARAYADGNDREAVGNELGKLIDLSGSFSEKSRKLTDAMLGVYCGELCDADVDALVSELEK